MATEGVTVTFTEDGIAAIARIAAEVNRAVENIGARRLHTVMERVFEELSFAAPDRGGDAVTVDAAFVEEPLGDLLRDGRPRPLHALSALSARRHRRPGRRVRAPSDEAARARPAPSAPSGPSPSRAKKAVSSIAKLRRVPRRVAVDAHVAGLDGQEVQRVGLLAHPRREAGARLHEQDPRRRREGRHVVRVQVAREHDVGPRLRPAPRRRAARGASAPCRCPAGARAGGA